MKKILVLLIAIVMLSGCSSFISKQIKNIDADVATMADSVWQQKDCRAGLAKSLVEVRSASLEVKSSVDKLIEASNQDSEEFKKCYYLGNWFNALEFAAKDVKDRLLPDLLDLISGVVK